MEPDEVTASVEAAQASRPLEYQLTDSPPAGCAVCEREVMTIPLSPQPTGALADQIDLEVAGEGNILQYPTGTEVFPANSQDAPFSVEGVVDTLCRNHPEEAIVLLGMLMPEGTDIGGGYDIEYASSSDIQKMRENLEKIDTQRLRVQTYANRMRDASLQQAITGREPELPAAQDADGQNARDSFDTLGDYARAEAAGAEADARRIWQMQSDLQRRLSALNYWHVDNIRKKIVLTDQINYNIDRPLVELDELFEGDDDVVTNPTNVQGAAWLAKIIEYNLDPEKEFVREKWRRRATGTFLVIAGLTECAAGVIGILGGAGTGGISVPVGMAVTTAGYNALEQGIRMVSSADPMNHSTYLDRAVGSLGDFVGGEGGKRDAAGLWGVFQLAAGMGGGAYLARTTLVGTAKQSVMGARSLNHVVPTRALFHSLTIDGVRLLKDGVGVTMKHLPSGRGILVRLPDGGKFLISAGDNLLRVMLRARIALPQSLMRRVALLKVDADPVRKLTGPASQTHAAEIEAMKRTIREAGGAVDDGAAGRMAYEPGTTGSPGTIRIDPDASYSGWLHEYQHFLDDMAAGYPGMSSLANKPLRWSWERRAYQKEIDYVKGLRDIPQAQRDAVIRELEILNAREHAAIFYMGRR